MTKKTRNTLFIVGGLVAGALIVAGIWKARQPNTADEIMGFGRVLEKTRRTHPEIYEWYNQLTTDQQMFIEEGMNPSLIQFLYKELSKKNLSPEVLELLRKAGYRR